MSTTPHHLDFPGILVVDDDRDAAASMAGLLRLFGRPVQVAHDGYEALEIARRDRPWHVLLDIVLPGLDGYEVAARLRHEVADPIVLIAITGHGQEQDRGPALAAGFDHYFLKPLDQDALNALLATLDEGLWVRQTDIPAPSSPMAGGGPPPGTGPAEARAGRSDLHRGDPAPEMKRFERPPMRPARRRVEIVNALGLHLRAADRLVRTARQFQAELRIARDGRRANGRSILDLATLAAGCGTWIELEATGPDAEEAVEALCRLIARGFDE